MKSFFKQIVVWILTLEASLVLKKYKPKIVGITGSVGKTSAKDAIYSGLSSSFYVRKSEKSYNSEIGVPLTILGCKNAWGNPFLWLKNILKGLGVLLLPNHYPNWLVLEIGLDRPGDIERVVRWLSLDVCVFTRFAKLPVHVEYFDSPAELIKEKKKLLGALKTGGVLVFNYDDEELRSFAVTSSKSYISYGLEEGANIMATNLTLLYEEEDEAKLPEGINFKVEYEGSVVPLTLHNVVGHQHVYPMLSAVAVGVSQGLNLVSLGQALDEHKHPPGRMQLVEGLNSTLLIDDTYNSSPVAVELALKTLSELRSVGRKVCILGDMMELGKFTVEAHKEAGVEASKVCDFLITVGPRAHFIAEGAREAGIDSKSVVEFSKTPQACQEVYRVIQPKDFVLIKGSQSTRMERIVIKLMARPDRAGELLVRQDKEWLRR